MKRLAWVLCALITFVSLPAKAWDADAMNRMIEQTNFIVNSGCSGTLIDLKQRLILTNYHCIDSKVRVETREEHQPDGTVKKVKRVRLYDVRVEQNAYADFEKVGTTSYVSELVHYEKRKDLALLKLKADKIPHTQAAPLLPEGSKLQRGETVYIIGNPLGLDATVGQGLISNLNRTFQFRWTDGEDTPMIQHDAGTTGGNSGGSLFNNIGQLIGVPSAAAIGNPQIGLAIPIDTVKEFLREGCFAGVFDPDAKDQECLDERAKSTTNVKSNAEPNARSHWFEPPEIDRTRKTDFQPAH